MNMSGKVRICHIASGDLWAGAEVQVFNIIDGLIKINQFDIIAIIMNKGKLYNEIDKLGIRLYLVDERKMNFFKQVMEVRKIVKGENLGIIHSHRYKENILASIVKLTVNNRVNLLKTQHGSFNITSRYRMKFYRLLDKFFTKHTFERIVAVSEDIADEFRRFMPEKKINVVPNSILPERYDVKERLGTNVCQAKEDLSMAIIGRLVGIKNIDEFIIIMADLRAENLKIISYIVGDGPEKNRLSKLSKELGISKYVQFLGEVEDISSIYNMIDILFISSLHEGLPTVILEAMYFGKIVIARNVGGIPEVMEHNKNGFLYDSIEQAKGIVRVVYGNSSKYDYIRINANKTIMQNFNNINQSKKYSHIYQAFLNYY